jgi:hypothetical protein
MGIRNTTRNPFSKYSAEEELAFIDDIFYVPQYYGELKDLLSEGNSRFIIGQRGQGKSMLIHKLFQDLSKNHTLALLITRYDGIPLQNNENHLLCRILQSLVMGVAKQLYLYPSKRNQLNKAQRDKFALYIEFFYDEHCAGPFIEGAKEIHQIKTANFFKRIYNRKIVSVLNQVITGTIAVSTDLIRKSIGLDGATTEVALRDYLKELPEAKIQSVSLNDMASWDRAKLLSMLNYLVECCHSIGYESVVVLFDKIDEFPAVSGDIESVTAFTQEILRDTDLLLSNKIAIVFSLWSEIKRSLNREGVRFDKFREIDIRWAEADMEPMMNKRLFHFSDDKSQPVLLSTLIKDASDRKECVRLSEKSPRSLIRLLGTISGEMPSMPETFATFTKDAISKGMVEYCKNFDYESLNPAKLGSRDDLINWINRILRIKMVEFTIEDVRKTFAVTMGTASKHIETMVKLGLVKDSLIEQNGNPVYVVVDSRIHFMIARGVVALDE